MLGIVSVLCCFFTHIKNKTFRLPFSSPNKWYVCVPLMRVTVWEPKHLALYNVNTVGILLHVWFRFPMYTCTHTCMPSKILASTKFIGASVSEPHTGESALHTGVYGAVCLDHRPTAYHRFQMSSRLIFCLNNGTSHKSLCQPWCQWRYWV